MSLGARLFLGWIGVAACAIAPALAGSAPAYLASWGSSGSAPGQFNTPFGIAVDNGYVYVADQHNERVQKFTTGGTFVAQWPTGPIDDPTGIAVGPTGVVYVSLHHTHLVRMYSTTGILLGTIGSPGSAPGQFLYPVGIATDVFGNVYVADSGNNRVEKFTAGGALLMAWGGLNNPYGIAVNGAGTVYVSDRNDSQIHLFSSSGSPLSAWGVPGDGQVVFLNGLDFDALGSVYVIDSGLNNRVQLFSSGGSLLTSWGTSGAGAGQFQGPADIAVEGGGNVYVTDYNNNRIEVFGAGSTPTGMRTWGHLKATYR